MPETLQNRVEQLTADWHKWTGFGPAEVAEVVGMYPTVYEANVYGVQLPHHDGRAGCVALTLDGDASRDVLAGLAEHVTAMLPSYAVPLFLRITEGLGAHTTGTNKYLKPAPSVVGRRT